MSKETKDRVVLNMSAIFVSVFMMLCVAFYPILGLGQDDFLIFPLGQQGLPVDRDEVTIDVGDEIEETNTHWCVPIYTYDEVPYKWVINGPEGAFFQKQDVSVNKLCVKRFGRYVIQVVDEKKVSRGAIILDVNEPKGRKEEIKDAKFPIA